MIVWEQRLQHVALFLEREIYKKMRAIIAAAGTGGHINPGIAIANKIMEEEPDSKIIFIGTNRGLEVDLVKRAGYELKTIDAYGISRSFTTQNFKRLFKTIKSIKSAKNIIKEFKPDIIIGTGGYICVPTFKAANDLKIPYIIHESNALPGVATKLFSKKAKKVLLGFKEAKDRLKNKSNIVVTGTPTKVKNLHYSEEQIKNQKEELGFDKNKKLVLIFGGSQGAKTINDAVKDLIVNRNKKEENTLSMTDRYGNMSTIDLSNDEYQIIWAIGKNQYDEIKKQFSYRKIDIDNIKYVKALRYIYNMEEVMNIADLIVSRSGAMTITEIEKVGKPAIFVPFPYAAENHQEYNARAIERVGAAKVILDKDLNANVLDNTIKEIINDDELLKQMGKRSLILSINDVEDIIYAEIKGVVNN